MGCADPHSGSDGVVRSELRSPDAVGDAQPLEPIGGKAEVDRSRHGQAVALTHPARGQLVSAEFDASGHGQLRRRLSTFCIHDPGQSTQHPRIMPDEPRTASGAEHLACHNSFLSSRPGVAGHSAIRPGLYAIEKCANCPPHRARCTNQQACELRMRSRFVRFRKVSRGSLSKARRLPDGSHRSRPGCGDTTEES